MHTPYAKNMGEKKQYEEWVKQGLDRKRISKFKGRRIVPSRQELVDHSFALLVARTDTTVSLLTFAMFYILSSPEALVWLQMELRESSHYMKDEFDWRRIQQIPFLVSSEWANNVSVAY